MIVGGGAFYTELDDSRMCAIAGRLGSGKTLTALELAERYLKRGYRLVSNVRSVWGDDWDRSLSADNSARTVLLVDEGGLYVRTMKTVSALTAFARKLDCYIILAGRRLPHEEMCELVVEPFFDFRRNLVVPAKLWRWTQRMGKTYGGYFLQSGESGLYGTYDTVDPGDNPAELITLAEGWAQELFARYGRTYSLQDMASSGGDNIAGDAADSMAVSASRLRDAVSLLASQKRRGRYR